MKCIIIPSTLKVIRVKDGEAAELVQTKQDEYCPKHVYKKFKKEGTPPR